MPPSRTAPHDGANDVEMADAISSARALGAIALDLARARTALEDAVDRARNLHHVDLPPESASFVRAIPRLHYFVVTECRAG